MSGKTWSKEEIKTMLETNDKWLVRGLLAIYDHQTSDEKSDGNTKHENGVGFNGCDSAFLSKMAEFHKNHGYLTTGQTKAVRKAMLKYAGQLTKIANQK